MDGELISTSSPASEDLQLPPDGQDLKQSPFASKIPIAKESSAKTFHRSRSSRTSEISMGKNSVESISSQVDFLASQSLIPGSAEAKQMTVSSGRKWLVLYRKQNRTGCLLRTLLESSRWVSTKCFLTWQVLLTPARQSCFRLVPSMPTTKEKESGLWPTPTCHEQPHRNLKVNDRGRREPTNGKTDHSLSLADTVILREPKENRDGSLNPEFVEWLMGYPIGWTDCVASETQLCLNLHMKS